MDTPNTSGPYQGDNQAADPAAAPGVPPAYPPAYPTASAQQTYPAPGGQHAANPAQSARPAAEPYAQPAGQHAAQPAGQHAAAPQAYPQQTAPQAYPAPAQQPAAQQAQPAVPAYPQPAAQPAAAPQAYPQAGVPQAYPQPGTPAAPSSSSSASDSINAAASQATQKAAQLSGPAGDHIKFLWTSAQQLFKGQVTEVGQQLLTRKVPGVIVYVVWAVCAGLMTGVFKYRATSAITGAFAQLTGDTSSSGSAFGSAFATFFGVTIAFMVFGLLWIVAVYLALRWSKSKLDYTQTFSLVWGMAPYFIPLMILVFLWSMLTSSSGLLAFGIVAFPLGMFFTLLHEFQMLQCIYIITGANQKFPLLMAITATVFLIIVLPILELTVPLLFAFA